MQQSSHTWRIVISGGPGSGKTTLVNKLQKLGYHCLEEKSRQIIQDSLATGSRVLPWDDLATFSQKVFEQRVEQYGEAQAGINFYDRSNVDTLAYLPLEGLLPTSEFLEWTEHNPYHKTVFMAPPWEAIYKGDGERMESFEKANTIYSELMRTYQNWGYEVQVLPRVSPKKRIDFILETLRNEGIFLRQ